MNADSNVNYQETRKTKNKTVKREFSFKHDDKLSPQSSTSNSYSNSFEPCDYNFDLNLDMVVIIACKDNQETQEIEKKLQEKPMNKKILACHVMAYPIKREGSDCSWSSNHNLKLNNIIYHCISETIDPQSIVKDIMEDLNKGADQYIKSIQKSVEEQICKKIFKEFEDKLHEQADEYYKQKRNFF